MNDKFAARRFYSLAWPLCVAGLAITCLNSAPAAEPNAPVADRAARDPGFNGLLQFLDGAFLHGHLVAVETNRALHWKHPEAVHPIAFKPAGIAWIRFENSRPVALQDRPSCWFHFANGDEVFGDLIGLSDDKLKLRTWFATDLEIPRAALRSLQFLPKDFSIFYEGPTNLNGWSVGQGPQVWEYRDGALTTDRVGMIGRDFHLANASTVEFDLAWTGQFYLIMPFYTKSIDRFDYGSNSYMFYIRPGYITLQRIQANSGSINLGQAEIPDSIRRRQVHLEFHANKDEGTLTVMADGKLVQRWKDPMGFAGEGSGLVFYAQLNQSSVRISNIRVWQGDNGLSASSVDRQDTKEDRVYLANHDKMSGHLRSIQDGKLSFETEQTGVSLPLNRVTQILVAQPKAPAAAGDAWEVRALFAGGGAVTLDLTKWDGEEVGGISRIFGPVQFNPRSIRMLQFNLNRPETALAGEKKDEWEELDRQ